MKSQAKSSATLCLLAAISSLGCGGRAEAEAQQGNSAPGQAGQSQGGQGGAYPGGQGQGAESQGGQAGQGSESQAGQGGESQAGQSQGGQRGQTTGPALHISECSALCARAQASGCSGGENACVMVCATVTGFSSCQQQIAAWLDCAKAADVTCDASGVPGFPACNNMLVQTTLCAATTQPPPAIQKSCSDYCDQVETAGCTATTPLGDCRQTCGLAGMVISNCGEDYRTYLDCAVATGATCNANGQLNAAACGVQQRAYLACMMLEIGKSMLPSGTGGATAY